MSILWDSALFFEKSSFQALQVNQFSTTTTIIMEPINLQTKPFSETLTFDLCQENNLSGLKGKYFSKKKHNLQMTALVKIL